MTRFSKVIFLLFFVLFCTTFFIKVTTLSKNFQFDHNDYLGDYLVARHIAIYGESQVVGQSNSVFSTFSNSPFYEDFLAVFLSAYDNRYTLPVLNIVLQYIGIAAIYALGTILFGTMIGTVSASIALLSQPFYDQTFYMWNPSAAHPFYNLGYVGLAYGYKYKNIYAIYAALLVYTLTFGFGYYGILGYPLVLFLGYSYLRKQKHAGLHILSITLILIGELIYFYRPIIPQFVETIHRLPMSYTSIITSTPFTYFIQIWANFFLALRGILNPFGLTALGLVLFFACTLYKIARMRKVETDEKKPILWLTICLITYILGASILKDNAIWHFVALWCPGIILLVRIWLPKNISISEALYTLILLIIITAVQPSFLYEIFTRQSLEHIQYDAAWAITGTLRDLKTTYPTDWDKRFTILTFDHGNPQNYTDNIFWPFLEELTHSKLTKIQANGLWGHSIVPTPHGDDVIILVCTDYPSLAVVIERCASQALLLYPNHALTKKIFDYKRSQYKRYRIFRLDKISNFTKQLPH